ATTSAPWAGPMHGPDRLRIGPAQGAEVVATLEGRRGSRHRGDVQLLPHPERGALPERAARAVPDGIPVLPVAGRVAGVEPGGRPTEVADRDIRRERPVERVGE